MIFSHYGENISYTQLILVVIRCEFSNGDKNASVRCDASTSDIPLCYNSLILIEWMIG